jgi:hypothetical protein
MVSLLLLNETWTLRADQIRTEAAEMRFHFIYLHATNPLQGHKTHQDIDFLRWET